MNRELRSRPPFLVACGSPTAAGKEGAPFLEGFPESADITHRLTG